MLGKEASVHLLASLPFVALLLLIGCSATPKEPIHLVPDFSDAAVRTVLLPPVTFDKRASPPFGIDIDGELRRQLASALAGKGYRVVETADREEGVDAELRVHVDHLFISETFNDRQPPPVIDIEAEGRLVATRDGRELWRDRGIGKAGGAGGARILNPDLDRLLALSQLADRLLATLPRAPAP